ncbi:N-acetylornithine carbamoyltransferase [Marinicella rhabdoformis]|uniref:N-acetylornithine carbamoyltransferase n=1 Tax=Marinicella rhabdoformis TaxID=2580566 RepID=UPI0012AEBB77|nr:N-acetylornithine carbamoyltransferase [Marinicella rhabdoformis]
MIKHFLSTADWSQESLNRILEDAVQLKQQPLHNHLNGKSIALLFLNPSLRTRTSFELGMSQLGGTAIVLQPGQDAWGIEFEPGQIMDGHAEEHIKEVAKVLSSYVDMIAIRAFPEFKNWQVDKLDHKIKGLAAHATVPVINMETIIHPCQELAMMMTIKNHLKVVKRKKFVLTWTYHPKPLNTAVANSALLISSKFGMDVTLLCPSPDYILDQAYIELAKQYCQQHGSQFNITHDIKTAYQDADFVYAKSWGALPFYGQPEAEAKVRTQYKHFIVDGEKMAITNGAKFSHCLPLRRNVKATDEVMDADCCVAIEEAENRLHVQKAMMLNLMNQPLNTEK